MRPALLAWLALLTLAAPAAAAPPPKGLATYRVEGAVGGYAVGGALTVEDHRRLVTAHYFYASTLKDIPLNGRIDGETVTLQEHGGGTFHLRLVTNSGTKERPLNFYISTGLEGVWTRGSQRLPVRLTFTTVQDGPPKTRLYADVTEASDAAFEARVRQFVQGGVRGDRAAVAAAVDYPLTVRRKGRPELRIGDAAQLRARWDEIFTPAFVARLRTALPHEMFVRDGAAMILDGQVWFTAGGAKVINYL